MTRLKIILQSKWFYIIALILIIVYVIFFTKIIKYSSSYTNEEEITGIVLKKSKNSIILKGKDKVIVYLDEEVSTGDTITLKGKFQDPLNNTVPNTFNYKNYLYTNKIYKIFYVSDVVNRIKTNNPFYKIKNKLSELSNDNSLMSILIMGDKSLLDLDTYNDFKNVGIAHIIAVSGMHITILTGIISKLLFFLSNNKKNLIILLFLAFYSFIISFSFSIIRASISYLLKTINSYFNLNLNNYQILFITFYILVLLNPFNIFQTSFLYSIACLFAINISSRFKYNNKILNLFITSFLINIFILPITINLNYEINILTIFLNILVIPLFSYVIYPFCLLSFLIRPFIPIFSFLSNILFKIINIISDIKLFYIVMPKLNVLTIIIYYLILILFVFMYKKRYLLFIFVILLFNKYKPFIDANSYVYYMDVSQGDSSIIITLFKRNITMIDTGGMYNYNVLDNVLLFLKSIGISKLNTIILTHGDHDHMGEAINLVNNFKVEKVIFNCGEYNDLEKELIKVLDKKHIQYYSCIKELNIDNNKLYFLQTKLYDNENDNSNVIYTDLNGYKFMFMGDASITTEKEILNKYNLPDIDVLKVGHHGSKTSSSKEFINEMNPKYSIISVGKNNRYGHPNKEALDNLKDSKIYRTDQDGSIMFKVKNNKLIIKTCSP